MLTLMLLFKYTCDCRFRHTMKLATYIPAAVYATAVKQVAGQSGHDTPEYGDLIMLYRDSSGRPIPTGGGCDKLPTDACCLWPLALEDSVVCPSECKILKNDTDADQYEAEMLVVNPERIDAVTCAVDPNCTNCVMEPDFGRTNVFRSPEHVLAAQYDEVC